MEHRMKQVDNVNIATNRLIWKVSWMNIRSIQRMNVNAQVQTEKKVSTMINRQPTVVQDISCTPEEDRYYWHDGAVNVAKNMDAKQIAWEKMTCKTMVWWVIEHSLIKYVPQKTSDNMKKYIY